MEVLFHFVFQLVKISIIASVYATILLLLFKQLKKSTPQSWSQKVTADKNKFWFGSWSFIIIILFIWMFTYWGNHGLGDTARIPIGYDREIKQINGEYAFISPNGYEIEMFSIESYAVKNNYCTGKAKKNLYYIWNLETNDVETVESLVKYKEHTNKLQLPNSGKFIDFQNGYQRFWGGWRFWLLP
jgi:hypothetical protein